MRVLVLDSDGGLRDRITRILGERGISCVPCAGTREALRTLEREGLGAYDAIVAAGDAPRGTGWELLSRLRQEEDETPVLLTSDAASTELLVRALRAGADDLLTSDAGGDEIVARLEAIVRRRRSLPVLRVGDVALDLARRAVHRGDRLIELSPKEFDLLRVLAEARGRPLSRTELFHAVWKADFVPETTVVEVLVARLRRKMDRPELPPLIQTLTGRGYRLALSGSSAT